MNEWICKIVIRNEGLFIQHNQLGKIEHVKKHEIDGFMHERCYSIVLAME